MSKKIRKAVFPVGGLGTRFLPATKAMPKEMLPVLDKPLIQYAFEEARAAGIEEFIFITGRGKTAIEDHFDRSIELEDILKARKKNRSLQEVQDLCAVPGSVIYIRQQEPKGLGHAILCAQKLLQDEPFAVILADDLILSSTGCLSQMIESYQQGNMLAVTQVPLEEAHQYGVVSTNQEHIESSTLFPILNIEEKPSNPCSNWAVIGRYILEPAIFDFLRTQATGVGDEIQLTDAIKKMMENVPTYGYSYRGRRFDCGTKIGMLEAQIHFALENPKWRPSILKLLNAVQQDISSSCI